MYKCNILTDHTRWFSGRALELRCAGGHRFKSWLGHTKDFKNDTFLLKRLDQANIVGLPVLDCKM